MKKLIGLAILFSVALFALTSSVAEESESNNFSITGDFSTTMATDFSGATIVVKVSGLSDDGKPTQVELASTEIVDGKFTLEGFVDEATIASVSLTFPDVDRPSSVRAIVEPGSELTLEYIGPYHNLVATGEGLHAELISSWASDPEYLDASIAYGFYMESIYARMDKQQAALEAKAEAEAEATATEAEEVVAESDTPSAEVDEERVPSEHAEIRDWASMECADYTVVDYVSVIDRDRGTTEYPLLTQSTIRMSEIMSDKRNAVLEKIAVESDDPKKRLFAMELGALGGFDQQQDALSVWQHLSELLDEETVATNVQPQIENIERRITIQENDEYLVPGVFAPTFTLPNLEGQDVMLASILEEKEVVVVDFWASWCGPCIAQFPHLKQLYADYAEKGFEIVGVSVDSSQEDWVGATEEHEPPWINLGEIVDQWGPISQEFGVRFIPHAYILDDEGCIMKKDLQPDELEDFLKARLDT